MVWPFYFSDYKFRQRLLRGIAGAETAIGYDQAVGTAGNIVQDAAERTADLMVDRIPGIDGKRGMTGDLAAVILSQGRRVYISDI